MKAALEVAAQTGRKPAAEYGKAKDCNQPAD